MKALPALLQAVLPKSHNSFSVSEIIIKHEKHTERLKEEQLAQPIRTLEAKLTH